MFYHSECGLSWRMSQTELEKNVCSNGTEDFIHVSQIEVTGGVA